MAIQPVKYMTRIYTGDDFVDREMTEQETADLLAIQAKFAETEKAEKQAEADKLALKQATLAKLGLTADEVAALLS
jgi:hypothetical protein